MRVEGKHYRTIWFDEESGQLRAIDQTALPHEFRILALDDLEAVCHAIRTMQVRGAPLIGAAAAFGLALALREDASSKSEERAARALVATRPTAVNLAWAVRRVREALAGVEPSERAATAWRTAQAICDEDAGACGRIGAHGLPLLEKLWAARRGTAERLNVLTHCNAGWLAAVDWGTALSPVYKAHEAGIPLHVWVDETRPRIQGASLTAWELGQHGVPHTVIPDNTAGHVLQRGLADACIVGSDRTTARGDVCNKIGTYMLALAAKDNQVPFYAAVPVSSIDFEIEDGLNQIPIEERDTREVTEIRGLTGRGQVETVRITPAGSPAMNYAFDVTPARLVTALITEEGVFPATPGGLTELRARLHRSA
jgi:methylthioribose-1-phosphate isomerase